jgi:FkbM family methyltransferase
LNCIFLGRREGVFIDVGANHPTIASNTYFFYKMGWRGVNIDALPDAIDLFNRRRKKDTNIEVGVNEVEAQMNFYMFKESSYNTFNEALVDDIKKVTVQLGVKKIAVKPLSLILKHTKLSNIDFMSVDVEGLDLNVLRSNDWNSFRPKVVLVETFENGIEVEKSPIYQYMISIGYTYFCKSVTNAFYLEKDFYKQRFKK